MSPLATDRPIIHIGPETPFMGFMAGVFEEAAPGQSRYLIQQRTGQKLQSPDQGIDFERLPVGPRGLAMAVAAARCSRLTIVHSMSTIGALALLATGSKTTRFWSGWGGDYYGDDSSRDTGLLDPLTAEISRRLYPLVEEPRKSPSQYLSMLARQRAAKRADFFSAPIPSDFDVFRRRYPAFAGTYAQLNYASVEDTYSAGPSTITSNGILVGNSASFANNHLDVFAALSRHDLGGRKVVVPLSYGETPEYREAVLQAGKKSFGADFSPILDYMGLREYNALLAQCSDVVMGHHRQQALGNIGTALNMGARVFLSPRNPLARFLRELGATLGTISELQRDGFDDAPLGKEAVEQNRLALTGFWGRDRVVANARSVADFSNRSL